MGVAQNTGTGTGRYCDDTAGYRYRQKKCYRHIPNLNSVLDILDCFHNQLLYVTLLLHLLYLFLS